MPLVLSDQKICFANMKFGYSEMVACPKIDISEMPISLGQLPEVIDKQRLASLLYVFESPK